MHTAKKGQLDGPQGHALSAADQFYGLASSSQRLASTFAPHDALIATEPARIHRRSNSATGTGRPYR
jgi:hypothetical protein